jgi:hypothetical protein
LAYNTSTTFNRLRAVAAETAPATSKLEANDGAAMYTDQHQNSEMESELKGEA